MIKVDSSQAAIIDALRAVGAIVEIIQSATGRAGIPDLLVGFRGVNYLMEVKIMKGKRKPKPAPLSDGQWKWHRSWGGQVAVVATPLDAMIALGLTHCPLS